MRGSLVVESGHEAERDDVVLRAVNPRAAILIEGQRVAHGVDHFARSDAPRRQLPQFLNADTVGLWIAFAVELEAPDELLGQRAARAFGKDHDLRLQIVARLEVRFLLADLVYTFVVGAHAAHASGLEEQLRACKAGEHRNAGFFHFSAQPLYKLIDRDHVVAVIAHGRRRNRELELAGAGQVIDGLLDHGGVERRFLLEVRQQLAHGARVKQRS